MASSVFFFVTVTLRNVIQIVPYAIITKIAAFAQIMMFAILTVMIQCAEI